MPSFQPTISVCYNFVLNDREQRATIVISPTCIRALPEAANLSWTCSRGAYCGCVTCSYARDAMQGPEHTGEAETKKKGDHAHAEQN